MATIDAADEADSSRTQDYSQPSLSDVKDHGIPLPRASNLMMVLETPKGRGVFTTTAIAAGTIVEVCPVLVIPPVENDKYARHTVLHHYTYNWPAPPTSTSPGDTEHDATKVSRPGASAAHSSNPAQAVPLGLGGLFNHTSRRAKLNVGWTRQVARGTITYVAVREIHAGEELCISYGSKEHLTFVDPDGDSSDEEGLGQQEGTEEEDGMLGIMAED